MSVEQRIEPEWRISDGAGRDMGIGIVGCGGIVRYAHLPAYREAGLRVLVVHDVDPDRARAVAEEFGIPAVASSVEEVATTPGVAIVDVAVPPWEQPAIVAQVAALGRHLLCQKPLALEYPTAAGEVAAAERAGVLLAVNQQMRWAPCVAATRSLVRQGAIGRPREARIQVDVATPWHMWPWLASAPRLEVMFHSIHYLDALRSLLGDPVWVTSIHGRDPVRPRVAGETRTTTVLEYADGLQAQVIVSHDNDHGTPGAHLVVRGETGAIEGIIGLLYDYPTGRIDTLSLMREGAVVDEYEFDRRWIPDAFLGPMGDLMDAIATGREPITSGRDNLGTVAVALAAYRSAEERRSVRVDEVRGAAQDPA